MLLLWILLIWIVLSIPAGMLLGALIRRGSEDDGR